MRRSHPAVVLASTLLSLMLAAAASAQVSVTGDVRPADDPRTTFGTGSQEGLPAGGNAPNFATADLVTGNLTDENGAGTNVGQPNYERNLNIVVGENTFGRVDIVGTAALRYGHLVLGGSADPNPAAPNNVLINLDPSTNEVEEGITRGFGVMRISGFGAVFNNHPNIVPTVFQDPTDPLSTFFDIPTAWNFNDINLDGDFDDPGESFAAGTIQRDALNNHDAYIGLTGQGLLEITNGGRAEIQDAVILGLGAQAFGEVVVSGVGSNLTNYGGLDPTDLTTVPMGGTTTGVSHTVVGGYGRGVLRIEDGGTVQSLRGAAVGNLDFDTSTPAPEQGGSGRVVVDGAGSRWDIVAGENTTGTDAIQGLILGGFVNFESAATLEPVYRSSEGQGSLTVSNGGLVRINDIEADGNMADDGDLRIGRLGDLNLDAGEVEVQNEVYSDGVIAGDGKITAGRFINRSLGEVRIGGGEHLTVFTEGLISLPLPPNTDPGGAPPATSTTPTVLSTPAGVDNYFGINLGKIEVIGDEAGGVATFEYERSDDGVTAPIPATTEVRFWNATRTNGGGVVEPGEIIVNHGHLHFRAGPNLDGVADGLRNDGLLAFVGGDNLVTGTIENTVSGDILVDGSATLSGETFVTFADAVANAGTLTVSNGRVAFLPGSTAYSGTGTLSLIGGSTATVAGDFELGEVATGAAGSLVFRANPTGTPQLIVDGDFFLEAGSSIAIDGQIAANAGDTLNFITVLGATNDLETELGALTFAALPTFVDPDLAASITVDAAGSLVVEVLSLSASMAMGADFTGDGTVDAADLDIFSMFFGLEEGATALTGDANGDGAVDGADFILIQEAFGSAVFPAAQAVPEPTAAGLLLLGLAGAATRRRRAC